MFETTATGYIATDETVAFWRSRDTCPACQAIVEAAATANGRHEYVCGCEDKPRWTREI